jgi:hypothetical protein
MRSRDVRTRIRQTRHDDAGIATLIVVALYFGFYFFVYLPRGAMQ